MSKTKTAQLGSIGRGTMRKEDLIPCFFYALEELDAETAKRIGAEYPFHKDDEPDYANEDADYMLEALSDALNDVAPPFAYFGANEGDGSDYGFWLSQDEIRDAIHDGCIVQVESGEDRTTSPGNGNGAARAQQDKDGGAEYYLSVTDHGNMTLYTLDGEEVWSVV